MCRLLVMLTPSLTHQPVNSLNLETAKHVTHASDFDLHNLVGRIESATPFCTHGYHQGQSLAPQVDDQQISTP